MVVYDDADQFGGNRRSVLVLAGDFKGKSAAGGDFDDVERYGPQTVHFLGDDVFKVIAHRYQFKLVLFQNSEGLGFVVTHRS